MTCDSFRQLCTWAIRNVLPHPPPFRQYSTVSHTETYNRRTQYDESTCWANVLLLLRPSSATIGKVSLSSSARWWIVRWTRRARNSSRQRRRRTCIAKLDSRVRNCTRTTCQNQHTGEASWSRLSDSKTMAVGGFCFMSVSTGKCLQWSMPWINKCFSYTRNEWTIVNVGFLNELHNYTRGK